jgi:hypothetical protein
VHRSKLMTWQRTLAQCRRHVALPWQENCVSYTDSSPHGPSLSKWRQFYAIFLQLQDQRCFFFQIISPARATLSYDSGFFFCICFSSITRILNSSFVLTFQLLSFRPLQLENYVPVDHGSAMAGAFAHFPSHRSSCDSSG